MRDPQDPHFKLIRRLAQSLATNGVNEKINNGLFSAAFQRILYPGADTEAGLNEDVIAMDVT